MNHSFPPLKTLLLADSGAFPPDLTATLIQQRYETVATTSGRFSTLRMTQALKPHLVLMMLDQDVVEKLETIREIMALRTTAVIVIMKEWEASLAKRAMDAGASGYMLRPFDASHVSTILETSWHHFQKVIDLQENLELRKLLEKTKGILMKEQFITEEEAHQRILKMSQDQGVSLKDLCQSIATRTTKEKLKNV